MTCWVPAGCDTRGRIMRGHVERTYLAAGPVDGFVRTPPRALSRMEIARNLAVNGYVLPVEIACLRRWSTRAEVQ